ncbi:MAG TPA: efflux RND transporter periplasmic adaptor subunit [Limnobacter sp.]|nr:efflux RND transporter periplasmic adaptor subunit [Limnobacter sp.]
MKTLTWTGAVALVGLSVGAAVYWPFGQAQANRSTPQDQGQLARVNVVLPKPMEASAALQFSARLAPVEEASLYARSAGFVLSRMVDIGSKVKAGQVLATITAPELEASLASARAALSQREAELLLASRNRARVEPLGEGGAVSAQQIDEFRGMEEVAKANLNAAKAEVRRLQTEVTYLTVKAPFDGVITDRQVDRGDRVGPNDTRHLFRIINSNVMRVQVDVPQPQLFRVDSSKPGVLTLAERPGQPVEVKFKRSAAELNANSGTVRLEYEFNNIRLGLPAGLSGNLQVPSLGAGTSVTVPANTITYRDGGATLVVVDGNNAVQFRKVSLGKNMASMVEVVQGLGTEDRVVINPNALLKPGQVVEVEQAAKG